FQIPSTKLQINSKHQAPNDKDPSGKIPNYKGAKAQLSKSKHQILNNKNTLDLMWSRRKAIRQGFEFW
ncbi:MAG: hypothetical protein ACLFTS_03325, partial [Candidatus Paceibacterota bacterium]